MRNPSEVWKRLTDEEPLETLLDVEPPKLSKKAKRRLSGAEYEEVFANYWQRRPETAHDRELFVEATMNWAVFAFLHEDSDHGRGRNHEIADNSDTLSLIDRLFASSDQMLHDIKCNIEMRSVCWWDVQEHYHNVSRKDICMLADDLQVPLLYEAIERLKATGFVTWHSGVWTLSSVKSQAYIQGLKRRRKIFLAPEPSKLSRFYAA